MKAIKILAVLALVMFVVAEVGDGIRGFRDGWNAKDEQAALMMHAPFTLKLEVENALVLDTLKNQADGKSLPYVMERAEVDGLTYPAWYGWGWLLVIPFSLLFIYGFYCVVRVILSVSRGEVFTQENVRRMRFFAYPVMVGAFVLELYQWMLYDYMAAQVMLEGYRVASYTLKYPLFCYVMLVLFTEIFAAGVKLKEEQDLTI
mgnify:CR=1 FL=1